MDSNLKPYSRNEITISRSMKSPRPRGDGEESKNPISSDLSITNPTLHGSDAREVSSYPFEQEKNSISKNVPSEPFPHIKNIAERLTKVSLFTTPSSIILSEIPSNFQLKEKFLLRPVIVQRFNKPSDLTSGFSARRKEPKFVPYEPYKGCVNPILKSGVSHAKIKEAIASESQPHLELEVDEKEIANDKKTKIHGMIADFEKERSRWEGKNNSLIKENEMLRSQLEQLQNETSTLNQQLSTQSQVNNELKKLLVASIGEDVQGRVQCLTEDKARMATMIRKYSEKVDRDFEEKERMSIQCDVWRSKFLASSLLIDELAQWKGILIQRLGEAKEAVRILLEERDVTHPYLVNVYKMIYQVQEAFDPLHADSKGVGSLDSCDVVSLSSTSSSLAENIRDRLLGTLGRSIGCFDLRLPDETRTPGEKIALQVLDNCLELCCKNMSLTLNPERSAMAHRFHPNTRYEKLTMNCCGHCNGDIKVV